MLQIAEHLRSCGKPDYLATGRATTGLYLLLESLGIRGREVLLPVNICYSLVYAVLISGNRPRLVDVDEEDGNLTLQSVRSAWSDRVAAAVVPHHLGVPCRELPGIASCCRDAGAALVEDCAALWFDRDASEPLGATGDYAIFSFAAGKPADAGIGGLLAAAELPGRIVQRSAQLPPHSAALAAKAELFAALFRTVYHSDHYRQLSRRMRPLLDYFDDLYCYRLADQDQERLEAAYRQMCDQQSARQQVVDVYDQQLPWNDPRLARFPHVFSGFSWRYHFHVDSRELRAAVIAALLRERIAVSAWYPPVHWLFGVEGSFPRAERFAARVLNLPLNAGRDTAERAAAVIRDVVQQPP